MDNCIFLSGDFSQDLDIGFGEKNFTSIDYNYDQIVVPNNLGYFNFCFFAFVFIFVGILIILFGKFFCF